MYQAQVATNQCKTYPPRNLHFSPVTVKLITVSHIIISCFREERDMDGKKIFILFALFATANSGPMAYGICQTGCNAVWVACVAAAGGVAGVSTGGVGVPAAILACNAAQGVCMAACVAAGLLPTL